MKANFRYKLIIIPFAFMMMVLIAPVSINAEPLVIKDSRNQAVSLGQPPQRVVSLVPSLSEIIEAIGAGGHLVGVTYHDTYPAELASKAIVGGFASPNIDKIADLNPDVILVSERHTAVVDHFKGGPVQLICLEINSIDESFSVIEVLGRLFNRADQSEQLINNIRQELDLVARKVARIPENDRKRVLRVMGPPFEGALTVLVPGDDSFQNEMIAAAGGLPLVTGQNGATVQISADQWQRFNPQVVYSCGPDMPTITEALNQPPWNTVDAVANHQVNAFPCILTCRAATHTGDFVGWLASRTYPEYFSRADYQVYPNGLLNTRSIDLDLAYVKQARIQYTRMHDFVNKTLMIELAEPMTVLSTLEGQRKRVRVLGNHYSPAPCWSVTHHLGLDASRDITYRTLGVSAKKSAFLFTGADLDRLAIGQARFRDMAAYALVTAGVQGNAVSMSKDIGHYYEPGTINIIVLTNMKLTPRAMSRAVISITEAKTLALLDLDIRSTYQPLQLSATGTGTDNIIVAQGTGATITMTGGHSKMGELIARAVYDGVREAVYKQNGIVARRSVFQRLEDRGLTPLKIIGKQGCACGLTRYELASALEALLMNARYAGFVEMAMVMDDKIQAGLIEDISTFDALSHRIAEEIAGQAIDRLDPIYPLASDDPTSLDQSLNALLNGLSHR